MGSEPIYLHASGLKRHNQEPPYFPIQGWFLGAKGYLSTNCRKGPFWGNVLPFFSIVPCFPSCSLTVGVPESFLFIYCVPNWLSLLLQVNHFGLKGVNLFPEDQELLVMRTHSWHLPSWQTVVHVTFSAMHSIAPNPFLAFYLHNCYVVLVLHVHVFWLHHNG